jgi:transposase
MRPIGTAQELERRRRRAVELMDKGESPTVIARILGVCRTSLYRWKAMARSSPDGLAAQPHPGPKPRLSADQMAQLEGLLKEGAKAHGWKTQLWTAERVADLIQRRFAIRFHPEHARKILKRRLKWTSQVPQRRAKERDEAAIAR